MSRVRWKLRTDGDVWLRRIVRLLDERLTFAQHRDLLSLAGRLALLVGCVENDAGQPIAAEATRRYARDLATEVDDRDVIGVTAQLAAQAAKAWARLGNAHQVELSLERVGNDALATLYADEVLRAGVRPDRVERSPMRNQEARITLAVAAARAGDADAALDYGLEALEGDRRSAPSLTLVAHELTREFHRADLTGDPRARAYADAVAEMSR